MDENQYVYNDEFFNYINDFSKKSALEVITNIKALLNISSVLDVGCGQGAWLKIWQDLGVTEIKGIDGNYVDKNNLLIDNADFIAHDLSKEFNLNQKFDLVTSFEVAEHITDTAADIFISSLISHGDIILFSAAVPGQGGEGHVNEQDYPYWIKKFNSLGYSAYDALRPKIINNNNIAFWYRYNTFLFVKDNADINLDKDILKSKINNLNHIMDYSPLVFKIRKSILKRLPYSTIQKLSVLNHKISLLKRRLLSSNKR
jgi:SAM-dependent methyltransferase